ncbi:beta strand repeat-containing protein [Vibrio sp. RC27]
MSFQLKVVASDGQTSFLRLSQFHMLHQAQPGAVYTLVDSKGNAITDDLELRHYLDRLEIIHDEHPVAVLEGFYAEISDSPAYSFDGHINSSTGEDSFVLGGDVGSEPGVVWNSEIDSFDADTGVEEFAIRDVIESTPITDDTAFNEVIEELPIIDAVTTTDIASTNTLIEPSTSNDSDYDFTNNTESGSNTFLYTTLGVVGAAGLAALAGGGSSGGGSGGSTSSSSVSVTVSAVAGEFTSSVTASVYDQSGNLLTSQEVDMSNGDVSLSFNSNYEGPIVVVISNPSSGAATYIDETTGAVTSLDTTLAAMTSISGGSVSVSVTPLTELAVRELGIDSASIVADSISLTTSEIDDVNDAIGSLFGITDITGSVTVLDEDYDSSDGVDEAELYGQVLAMLSGADSIDTDGDGNTGLDATLDALSDEITIDDSGEASITGNGFDILDNGAAAFSGSGSSTSDESLVDIFEDLGIDTTNPIITSGSSATATTLSIDENSESGRVVYSITATDDNTLNYSISGTDASAFVIDGSTGEVTLNSTLDYETKDTYEFSVDVTDTYGNSSSQTITLNVNDVDDSAPSVGSITVTDDIGSVTGPLSNGDTTDDSSIVLSGTCELGSTISIYDGSTLLGAATVSGTTWSYNASVSDAITYSFNYTETDSAGNTSTASSSISIIGDTTAPTTTISGIDISVDTGSSDSDFITSTASQTVTATLSSVLESDESLYISVDAGTNWIAVSSSDISGTSISTSATLSGISSIQFKVIDDAGNEGAIASQSYTLDTTAPTTTISGIDISVDTGSLDTDFVTNTASQTVTATLSSSLAIGEALHISVDGGTSWTEVSSGDISGTSISTSAILSGSSSIQFKVIDDLGNEGTTASQSYTLDMTVPTTTISGIDISDDTGSLDTDFVTNIASQTVTATLSSVLVSDETLYISVDGGTSWSAVSSSDISGTSVTTSATLSGTSSIQFKVVDDAGNEGAIASQNYTLNTTVPTTTISGIDISNDTGSLDTDFVTNTASQTVTATLSSSLVIGEALHISVDGGTSWAEVSSGDISGTTITTSAILSGSSSIQFKVIDDVGNEGTTASQSYTLDTTATITISAIETDNIVDDTEDNDVTITGTTTGIESGQIVSITIKDSSDSTVTSTTATVGGDGSWTAADIDMSAYTDGDNYTVSVSATDVAGNNAMDDQDIAMAVDVVFDLTTSNTSAGTFSTDTSYTIYIVVNSNSSSSFTSSWTSASELGADDAIVLVDQVNGNGTGITLTVSGQVTWASGPVDLWAVLAPTTLIANISTINTLPTSVSTS